MHGQHAGDSRSRRSGIRSTATLHRQLSDDICLRAHRGRNRQYRIVERTSHLYRQALAHWDADDLGPSLPPRVAQFRLDLRLIAGRLSRFVGKPWSLRLVRGITIFFLATFELLLVSAVMQMGLALPMAYYFHRATTIGLPANIAVVPLTQILMPTAVLAVSLSYISPLLAKLPAVLTGFALRSYRRHRSRLGRSSPGRSSRRHPFSIDDHCSFRRPDSRHDVRAQARAAHTHGAARAACCHP